MRNVASIRRDRPARFLRHSIAGVLALSSLALSPLSPGIRSAQAQESLDDIAGTGLSTEKQSSSAKLVEANGYIDNRFEYSHIAPPPLAPVVAQDTPTLQDILELNVQLKVHLGKKAFVYADVSLFLQGGTLYYGLDANNNAVQIPDHSVAALQPLVVPSELYISYSPTAWLNFLVGKKRIVWGSGFAFNPTDLINPPKDPTDPNLQRSGAWIAKVELPFERFTLSALFAPAVTEQNNGLPTQFLYYQSYDSNAQSDKLLHYLVAARLYALIFDADINLTYTFSNQYEDNFKNKSRFGASFSRYFLTDYELHFEALFQQGSARSFMNHNCVADGIGCNIADPSSIYGPSKLDSTQIYPRVVAGARTIFRDESSLSIEYYYQSDGYSNLEFEDMIRGLALAGKFGASGSIIPSASSGALPARFNFDPLRRHYLIASYSKPKIKDDFVATLSMIVGLTDLSMLITPSISWTPQEWLSITLYGYIPVRSIPVGQVQVNDVNYSEYSILPFDFRGMLEARAFY